MHARMIWIHRLRDRLGNALADQIRIKVVSLEALGRGLIAQLGHQLSLSISAFARS
jgi:hypothetical protein